VIRPPDSDLMRPPDSDFIRTTELPGYAPTPVTCCCEQSVTGYFRLLHEEA